MHRASPANPDIAVVVDAVSTSCPANRFTGRTNTHLTSPLAWPDKNCVMPVVPPWNPAPRGYLQPRIRPRRSRGLGRRSPQGKARIILVLEIVSLSLRSVSTMANRDRLVRSCAAAILLTIGLGLSARSAEYKGKVKAVDVEGQKITLNQEGQPNDLTLKLTADTTLRSEENKPVELVALKPAMHIAVINPTVQTAAENPSGEASKGILAEFWHNFTHNLFKPLLLFFLPGVPGPDLEGQVRVSLCDLPGAHHLPSDRHRLAWRRGTLFSGPEGSGQRGRVHGGRVHHQQLDRCPCLRWPLGHDRDAADRQGNGGRILRFGLGRHVRNLPGCAGHGSHSLRCLHAGDAGGDGDSRLPGGALPGLPVASSGHGRAGNYAR